MVQVSEESEEKEFNQDVYDQVSNAWNIALTQATPPFQGDLENQVYVKITQGMRDFKPEDYPAQ